jgi:hypothetical protein
VPELLACEISIVHLRSSRSTASDVAEDAGVPAEARAAMRKGEEGSGLDCGLGARLRALEDEATLLLLRSSMLSLRATAASQLSAIEQLERQEHSQVV